MRLQQKRAECGLNFEESRARTWAADQPNSKIVAMSNHKRKVALITGAGRGSGKATAVVLGGRDFHLAVHEVDATTAGETTALLSELWVESESFTAYVSNREAMRGVVAAVKNRFGQIDALINNAGTSSDRCPVEEVTEEIIWRSIRVNLAGTLWTTQAAIAGMKRRGSGSIVNLSSIQALAGWTEGATYTRQRRLPLRALEHQSQCRCARAYRN